MFLFQETRVSSNQEQNVALQALKKFEPKALNLCSGSINSADAALSLFTLSTRARSGVLVA